MKKKNKYDDVARSLLLAGWIEENADPKNHQDVLEPLYKAIDDGVYRGPLYNPIIEKIRTALEVRKKALSFENEPFNIGEHNARYIRKSDPMKLFDKAFEG